MNRPFVGAAIILFVLIGLFSLVYYGLWRVVSDKELMQMPAAQPISRRRTVFSSVFSTSWTVVYLILGGVAIWYLRAWWLGVVAVIYFIARRLLIMWAPARFWTYLRGSRRRSFTFILATTLLLPIMLLIFLLWLLAATAVGP